MAAQQNVTEMKEIELTTSQEVAPVYDLEENRHMAAEEFGAAAPEEFTDFPGCIGSACCPFGSQIFKYCCALWCPCSTVSAMQKEVGLTDPEKGKNICICTALSFIFFWCFPCMAMEIQAAVAEIAAKMGGKFPDSVPGCCPCFCCCHGFQLASMQHDVEKWVAAKKTGAVVGAPVVAVAAKKTGAVVGAPVVAK